MDENSSAVDEAEESAVDEAEETETQDSEVPTEEGEPKEIETGESQAVDPEIEKKAAEAKAAELRQVEIDVHSLYNLAQHSRLFVENPKFHMGGYIRIIGFLDKLEMNQAPAPAPEPARFDRAVKRREQKEIDKGLKNVKKAMDTINDASTE